MHKLTLALFFVSLSFIGSTQENNIWYFGSKAGLSFNASPTGVVPTILENSELVTNEGTSSICNKNGELLFYTNGRTIYNRAHEIMSNGDGLLGHPSAVQSSVIAPLPGNSNLFYVFTTDAIENDFEEGYRYSIVDISLSGGLGEVTAKNVPLSSSCTERLVAARHADGTSIWIILNDQGSDIFRAYLLSCTGLSSTPVISIVGDPMEDDFFGNAGVMKVSPDGKLLCQTHFASGAPQNFSQLFNFDNLTGKLSNPRKIVIPGSQIINAEFSPDSKLLYLLCPFDKELYQVESTLATEPEIFASRYLMPIPGTDFRSMQLAPDGKIYIAQLGKFLSTIGNPNAKGAACNLQMNSVDLSPKISIIGLPNFINDLSVNPSNGFKYEITDSCTSEVQFTGYSTLPGTITWEWDFGDGNVSGNQSPLHVFPVGTESYTVKLKIYSTLSCDTIERSAIVNPGGVLVSPLFNFTVHCDSGFVRFHNHSSVFPGDVPVQMRWDFGDGNFSSDFEPVYTYASGGTFNVTLTVETSTACLNRSLTLPVIFEEFDIQAPADMVVEAYQPVQLFVTGGGSEFTWSPKAGLSDSTISNPIAIPPKSMWYKVTVVNESGCVDSDSVYIKVNPFPGIYVPTGFTPNNDGLNDLFRPTITKEYTLEEFTLFNRWGEKIYSTSQKDAGWNGIYKGVRQETGAYIWILRATDTRNGEKHALKGTFVLLH